MVTIADSAFPQTGLSGNIDPDKVKLRFKQMAKMGKYTITTPIAAVRGGKTATKQGVRQTKQDFANAKVKAEASRQRIARTLQTAQSRAKTIRIDVSRQSSLRECTGGYVSYKG